MRTAYPAQRIFRLPQRYQIAQSRNFPTVAQVANHPCGKAKLKTLDVFDADGAAGDFIVPVPFVTISARVQGVLEYCLRPVWAASRN